MTVSIQDAATKAINLGKQLKAIIDIGECLQELGSLEQAIAEAKRHSVDAKARCAEDQLEHQRVLTALKIARDDLEKIGSDAVASRLVAEQHFQETTRKANAEAAQTLKTATADSAKIILKAGLKVQAAERVSDGLKKTILDDQAELDEVRRDLKALKEKFG